MHILGMCLEEVIFCLSFGRNDFELKFIYLLVIQCDDNSLDFSDFDLDAVVICDISLLVGRDECVK